MDNMKVIKCKSATSGIAIGPVVLWGSKKEVDERKITNIEEEIKHFDEAYKKVLLDMQESIKNNDKKIAEIIEARKMMLEDESFIDEIKNEIKEGFAAEYAAFIVGKNKAEEFEKMDNEYMRARSADICDISNKLVNVLCDNDNKKILDVPSIVVVDEITPEEIAESKSKNIIAYVTKKGSMMSHASIVASNVGVPYIFNVDYDEKEILDAKCAVVDAEKATLFLNPDKNTIEEYNKRKIEEEKLKENYIATLGDVDNILEKANIKVYANIAGSEDVDMALENGASGIGLYRTEFLYMQRNELPSEDEQYEAYKSVVEKMKGKEVIIRTMDVGADKEAKCLNLPHEENPALGKRAIRICLDDTELFRTQLRALLRAAIYGNEKIMFPMIANEKEIDDIKEQIKIAEQELIEKNIDYKVPPIGIMVETPAAAILSKEFAKKVDFFSIGTNDLTQYTLAVDRTGKNLDRYYFADHEAVLTLIKMTVDGAKTTGISVGVCGEIASNPKIIPKLVEIGVDEFSMAPSKIFKAKQKILECIKEKSNEEKQNIVIDDTLVSPVDGEIVPMENIPDKAFSSGGLGRCIGIQPTEGKIYAPCDGVITIVADTKHAIGIKTKSGKEILIHVGIDTVTLNGQGFDSKVKSNDNVKKGDLLLAFDIDCIKKAKLSPIVILAITKEGNL